MTRRVQLAAGLALCAGLAAARCADREPPPAPAAAFQWRLPRGFPVPRVPPDNPMSEAKVALGRQLFYDTRLSGNGRYACASCHQQASAFTDGLPGAVGSTGAVHPRGAMSLANVAYGASLGWADPAIRTLEAQAAVPMFNEHPVELGLARREAEVVARFSSIPADVRRFRNAFPADDSPVSMVAIVKAIASFERTLISGDSAFDHYLYRDDRSALSPPAVRGMKLFFSERLRCAECHTGFALAGPTVYDGSKAESLVFHNTGLYNLGGSGAYPAASRGLFDATRRPSDMGRFRAPTLRNIALTAPYMHDGSIGTLDEVIGHYAAGGRTLKGERAGVGRNNPFKSPEVAGFTLRGTERADLVAFLESLTDRLFVTNPAFGPP